MKTENRNEKTVRAGHRRLQVGDIINEDTEFQLAPGHWRRIGSESSVSAKWMIGSPYTPGFYVPARQPIPPKAEQHKAQRRRAEDSRINLSANPLFSGAACSTSMYENRKPDNRHRRLHHMGVDVAQRGKGDKENPVAGRVAVPYLARWNLGDECLRGIRS